MDNTLETATNIVDINMEPSTPAGVKRSWETISQWQGFNEDSTAAYAGPPKKACTSWLASSPASVVPEATNLEAPFISPSTNILGFESTESIEPIPDYSSSTHLPPLADNIGYPQTLFTTDTSWQTPNLINQYYSNQIYDPGQLEAAHMNENWVSSNLLDNSYGSNWLAFNSLPFHLLPEHNTWASPQHTECGQQAFFFAPDQPNSISPDNCGIISNDGKFEYSNSDIVLQDEDRVQPNNERQNSMPSTTSSSRSQSIEAGTPISSGTSTSELPYDTCFGVVIFEGFKIQNDFLVENSSKDVILEVNGAMVIIKDTDLKYRGLLDQRASRAISSLLRDHNVEFSASVKTPKRIEVVIYGQSKQGEAIGDMLSNQDYFLQPPSAYDASRSYHNPQCLLDPDEDEPFGGYNELPRVQTMVIDEDKKSKVAELLDSATGPTDFRRVQVSDVLVTKLKEHQSKALSMMMEKESGNIRDAEFPSIWVEKPHMMFRFYNTVTKNYATKISRLCLGGLLADEMGLGKTLTTLALIATSSNSKNDHPQEARRTLIVCPMTTMTCWQDQIERHFKRGSITYMVYHGSTRGNDAKVLEKADVVLTTYGTLRSRLTNEGSVLRKVNWYRVVLDEAHIIRNRTSKTFQAVKMLKSSHRWCLTGTPIQNRLEDLGALVEFLRIFPFDDPNVFRNTFLIPINSGHQCDWERLRMLVKSISLRRTKNALDDDLNLPSRHETIHWVDLSSKEKTFYDLVIRHFTLAIDSGGSVMNTFQFILRLRQICNHGSDLLPQGLRSWLDDASEFKGVAIPSSQVCEACDAVLDNSDESSSTFLSCFHQICPACLQNNDITSSSINSCPLCNTDMIEGDKKTSTRSVMAFEDGPTSYNPSSKVEALLQNLKNDRQDAITSGQASEKSVVFSTWTGMLTLIGKALSVHNFAYQRLDGSMSLVQRCNTLKEFRTNPKCTVLLASLGSAAVGLDLTMATRVHIMEPGWNPLLEQQAIDRIHRLGQEKEVFTTRYIVSGSDSIEQYIQRRQGWKMNLIASSFDGSSTIHNKAETILNDLRRTICSKSNY